MKTKLSAQDKEQKALLYLQENHYADYASTYGEPGYQDAEKGILFADWNNVPCGLSKWLEKIGYALEWCDEWYVDHDYCKAYRTQPDCYQWEPRILLPRESCEYLTPDDDIAEWIEACENNPDYCLPSWWQADDIINCGFELHATGYEACYHHCMDDNPHEIYKRLVKDGANRVVFQKCENSQFYCRFCVWVDFEESNENA